MRTVSCCVLHVQEGKLEKKFRRHESSNISRSTRANFCNTAASFETQKPEKIECQKFLQAFRGALLVPLTLFVRKSCSHIKGPFMSHITDLFVHLNFVIFHV